MNLIEIKHPIKPDKQHSHSTPKLKKSIILCVFPAYMRFNGNNSADKAAKEAINILQTAITWLPNMDYYLAIRMARNFEWQKKGRSQ